MRQFTRAPLRGPILYSQGRFASQARILNIGEGGILLEGPPGLLERDEISFMIALIGYPCFKSLGWETLKRLHKESFSRSIVRAKAKVVRIEMGESPPKMACEFLSLSLEGRTFIQKYVALYLKNMAFVLNLLEGRGNFSNPQLVIKKILELWGEDRQGDSKAWRLQALHDYQSLVSC